VIEYFFALNLSEETVRAAVWQVNQRQTELVQLGKAASWDGQDKDSLLKAADTTLSSASEKLQPEPNGVIFGLPDSWADQETINPDKKILIKYLCTELGLKPLGFVVTSAAIIASLKQQEGTPLSAVLIQLSNGEINLTLVKLGRILGSQLVGRSGDLGADVEEGLSRFDRVEALPARIILYDGGGDFEENKQQLLSYDWEDKLPFIHFPKVEVFTSEMTVKAVALIGGSEAAQAQGWEIGIETLGFVRGEDAAGKETPVLAAKKRFDWQPFLTKIKNIKLPRFDFGRRRPAAAAGGLVIAVVGLLLLYWNLPQAKVVLYLEPQLVSETLELTLDPEVSSLDPESQILPVQPITKSLSGEKTAATTGTKIIGDPAKGRVTLYNKTASVKTFPAGTELLAADQLVFSLDEETTVASRSAEEDSDGVITITPGKAEASITAVNIGPESNLAADSRLSFRRFSEDDYYAKTAGLSGGTAREVKAVAAADAADLEAALTEELVEQAKAELLASLGGGQQLLEREDHLKLIDKNFSAAAGEPADELALSGQLDYQGLVYRQAELELLLQAAVKTKIPENFVIGEFGALTLGKIKDMKLAVDFEVKLLPRLDFFELKNNLRGRSLKLAEAYLTGLPQFVSAEIKILPGWAKTLKTLPHQAANIDLEVKPAL
jgi:hypothetical protein